MTFLHGLHLFICVSHIFRHLELVNCSLLENKDKSVPIQKPNIQRSQTAGNFQIFIFLLLLNAFHSVPAVIGPGEALDSFKLNLNSFFFSFSFSQLSVQQTNTVRDCDFFFKVSHCPLMSCCFVLFWVFLLMYNTHVFHFGCRSNEKELRRVTFQKS